MELQKTKLISDPNISAYFRFENNGIDTMHALTPESQEAPSYIAGKYGKMALFSQASGQYLGYGDVLDISSGALSLSVLYKSASTPGTHNVICSRREASLAPDKQQNVFTVHAAGNGGIGFAYRGPTANIADQHFYTCVSPYSLFDNKLHQLGITITLGTGSSMKAYIDGVLMPGSWTTGNGNSLPLHDATQKFTIGGNYLNLNGVLYSPSLDGAIDELVVATRILTATEMKLLAKEPFMGSMI